MIIIQKKELLELLRGELGWRNYLFAAVYFAVLALPAYYFEIWNMWYGFEFDDKDLSFTAMFIVSFVIFVFLATIQVLTLRITSFEQMQASDENFLDDIAVIIPCHNSGDVLRATLNRALLHFEGSQIFVADNNKTPNPVDDSPSITTELGCNYRYFSEPGKTKALYEIGSDLREIKSYKYFFLLDDDTLLPEKLSLSDEVFDDPKVAGLGLGIKIKDKNHLSQQMADWEYKLISTRWSVKSRLAGTAKMAHGIAVVWRADAFMHIYERNPSRTRLPFGEDGWSGLIARQKGWRIIQDSNNFVETFAPTRFFYNLHDLDLGCASTPTQISGYDATNMWKQRTLRWYRNYLKRMPHEFLLCLTYNAGSVLKNICYRLDWIYGALLVYWSIGIPTTFVCFSLGFISPFLFFGFSGLVYTAGLVCCLIQN
eukprot:CAMPEP_0195306664 /NCGR_PEP_ID=MMETSP0707-20130614/37315_1 /TAXON_ID=33640 /ORGANISM="Asterionellopsis glacialis, Strain CCMP134" /LENGTH=426 /DNA_ID=CAMNT_0040370885 /DNA_START=259 /DNA_END=1536 /DNA_ORIENTATION=-